MMKGPRIVWFCCPTENSTPSESGHLTAVQSRPRHQSREHRIQRHMSNLAADMASSGQCFRGTVVQCALEAERLRGFHCAWVPACAWGLRTDSSGYAEGGWRVVTSMRSVADLLVSRSCNETHWHRPVEGTFPPAASLSHLCRRLMPTVLRRPTPMELAELVAGAHIKRGLRSKQSIQRRLTGKQPPPPGNSLPQSSNPAAETVPEVEEHPVEKCATPWSTGCIENSGIQTSGACWTVCDKIMFIPQCWRPPISCSARLARRAPDCYLVLLCPVERSWRLERSYRWTISTGSPPRRGCMSKARCWWMPLRERPWSGSGELHPVRNFLELYQHRKRGESWFKFYGRPETVITDPEGCFRERLFREWLASKNAKWDPQPAEAAWRTGIPDKVLDVLKNAATRAARRAPEDTSCEALFDDCTEAHIELHRRRGYSPFQLLIGRSPPGLPLDGDKAIGRSGCVTSDGRHRLHSKGNAIVPILTKK